MGDICAVFWTISQHLYATWNWFTTRRRQTVPSHSWGWQQRQTAAACWWTQHAELTAQSRRRWCGSREDLSEALHAPNTDVHRPDLSEKTQCDTHVTYTQKLCYMSTTQTVFANKWQNTVSSVASRQHLRSANRGLLVVPCYRLSSYGRRAFSVAGPAIWNWLPDSMRDPAISRDSFWRFYFQLTCVHSTLELSGWCALQIYLLTYLLKSGVQLNQYHYLLTANCPIYSYFDTCHIHK